MTGNILDEILAWSTERPAWQRDALRRFFSAGAVTPDDFDDLTDICKAAHGLSASRSPQELGSEHLAITGGERAEPVSLASVTHHRGVNALAAEQTVTFGPQLTIVYGQNAAGKSGYTRILKRACRSRSSEAILGNVLGSEKPFKAQATIRFRQGVSETSFAWGQETPAAEPLAAVNVFDSHCAPVYLRDKTDVAFRPFGLDIFDRLSAACTEVKKRLEEERERLTASPPALPQVPEGTRTRALLSSLTSLTKPEEVRALATFSKDEESRLKELRDRRRDLQAGDPKRRARELSLKAQRLESVVAHVAGLVGSFGEPGLETLRVAAETLRIKREVLASVRETALTPELLPGTGGDAWRGMWEAASDFSATAYPGSSFPMLSEGGRCPLCQQDLDHDATSRLQHFQEYVSSTAQTEVKVAEAAYRGRVMALKEINVKRGDVTLAVAELRSDDPDLAQRATDFFEDVARVQDEMKQALADGQPLPKGGLQEAPETEIRAVAKGLKDRAATLQAENLAPDPKTVADLNELEARVILATQLEPVLNEIERRKRIAAYGACLEDTSTAAITRKGSELTKRLVTDQLRTVFQNELAKLEFTDLAVEIQAAGGAKGALFHRLVFSGVPGVVVTDVLSEGESRTLSLAAFLTELSTAASPSAIIFDDPVSSLDHIWRERIARRLVEEAKLRQVVVFTHDILFLHLLNDQAGREGVQIQYQHVRRDNQEPGLCSPDLPWIATRTKQRIGALKQLWQTADTLSRKNDREGYERDASHIYGLLRGAWEHALYEVLLNDVVEPYRPSIETKRARHLHDITEQDCKSLEEAMTECSRWMPGHDQAPADGTPFPMPKELEQRIQDFEDWVQRINKRRKTS